MAAKDSLDYFRLKKISVQALNCMVRNGDLSVRDALIDRIDFREVDGINNLHFFNCGVHNSTFRGLEINRIAFSSCSLLGVFFDKSTLRSVRMVSCRTQEVTFHYARISECRLDGCDVWCSFNDSEIEELTASRCTLGMQGLLADRARFGSIRLRHINEHNSGRYGIGLSLRDATIGHISASSCTITNMAIDGANILSSHGFISDAQKRAQKRECDTLNLSNPRSKGFINNTFYRDRSLPDAEIAECIYWLCHKELDFNDYYEWFTVDTSSAFDCAKITMSLLRCLEKRSVDLIRYRNNDVSDELRKSLMNDLFREFGIKIDEVDFCDIERKYGLLDDTPFVDISERLLASVAEDYGNIFRLSPDELEIIVCRLLERGGYQVKRVGKINTKDGGIDIIAWKKDILNFIIAVQVKHHKNHNVSVGSGDVREFAGAVLQNRVFNAGMIITSTDFTGDAKWLAEKLESAIHLKNNDDLKKWMTGVFTDASREKTTIELARGVSVSI